MNLIEQASHLLVPSPDADAKAGNAFPAIGHHPGSGRAFVGIADPSQLAATHVGHEAIAPAMATVFTERRQLSRMPADGEQLPAARRVDPPSPVNIELGALERSGYGVSTGTRSSIAEHFSQIKRPLLTNARSASSTARRLSLIMVTSSLPREGKTFCAIQLALSMALEIDTSVLLVDADVIRPEVMKRLGLEPRPGLLDLLTDRCLQLEDVVLPTNIPKLSVLPAGTPNGVSSELLASDAMESLLLTMSTRYPKHMIVFDTPPLLVTTEAKVLAARMGQVVMVVAASSTPRSALVSAFRTVEPCPIVMSLLNRAPAPAIPLYYGY